MKSESDPIELVSIPFGGSRNGLVSMHSGTKVCIYKGKMGPRSADGRTREVDEQPVFISFRSGKCLLGRKMTDALGNTVDTWEALGRNRDGREVVTVTSRDAAKRRIMQLRGYGSEFRFGDDEPVPSEEPTNEQPAGRRIPAGAK